MLGKPKFKKNQKVEFTINHKLVQGKVCIIDEYGTFEKPDEVSYDILCEDKLYKHIPEHALRSI